MSYTDIEKPPTIPTTCLHCGAQGLDCWAKGGTCKHWDQHGRCFDCGHLSSPLQWLSYRTLR